MFKRHWGTQLGIEGSTTHAPTYALEERRHKKPKHEHPDITTQLGALGVGDMLSVLQSAEFAAPKISAFEDLPIDVLIEVRGTQQESQESGTHLGV
jgi:hypothetical protein